MGYEPIFWFVEPSMNLSHDLRRKLALFCNVNEEAVIQSIDASTIYDVPNLMLEEGLDSGHLKN